MARQHSRSEVSARGAVALAGGLGGLLIFIWLRPVAGPIKSGLLFRHLPELLKNFWPLDLAVTCLCFMLLMQILLAAVTSQLVPKGLKGWSKFVLGFFLALGLAACAVSSAAFSWYNGIEVFIATAVAGVAMIPFVVASVGFTAARRRLWISIAKRTNQS